MSVVALIKLAEFQSPQPALLFADYCRSCGYKLKVEQQHAVTELYVAEQDAAAVAVLFADFIADPMHPRYQAAAWQQSNTVSMPRTFSWRFPLQGVPVTLLLLTITIIVYGWQQIDFGSVRHYLMLSEASDLWRWITPILIHFSLTHLIFNIVWWVLLGAKIEQTRGSFFLTQLMLSSALISNGLQFLLVGPNFGGLSGVVYALVGYCYLQDKLNGSARYPINDGLFVLMLLWLALGFFDVLWVNMANWAHLGGLGTGLLWATITRNQSTR